MNKFLGIALVILAVGIAVVPHYTDCLSQGLTVSLVNGSVQPMKCHWSAQAEIGVGIPLFAVGIMIAASRRKNLRVGASILGILLGAVALAIPNGLIGTCSMAAHFCNPAMKPAVNAMGSITIIGALGGLVLAWEGKSIK